MVFDFEIGEECVDVGCWARFKKWKNKIVSVTKMHRRKSKRKHEFFIVALRGKFYKLGHGPSLQ